MYLITTCGNPSQIFNPACTKFEVEPKGIFCLPTQLLMKFSHLHVHTQFSLLDGAASIKNLFKKAIADGQPAIAISDHGNMFGAFEFVKEANRNLDASGKPLVKPVVGCEFYITADRHKKQFSKDEKDPRHHQILLAKNEIGYKNLLKLTSLGYIEGMYSKYPRIDKSLINKYHEGLIATTCCLGALVPQTILKKGEEEGENELKWWLNIFQDDYYIELQRHGIPEQEKVNDILLRFAKKYNIKVIASNDSHYVDQSDFNAHDILLCVNTGEKQSTPANREFSDDDVLVKNKRFGFFNDQFFLKTQAEMTALFHDIPQAIDNTNEIVDKIDLLDLKKDIMLPNYAIPSNFKTQIDYLSNLTWAGANKRYKVLTPEIEERISFELSVIDKMGFAGYFLIVGDFIRHGKEIGVFVGPGRGSAAGSVVAYCTGITNIDPIKYSLLFERFLNPDRKSMPDIDTDFDDEGRQKVIDYVVEKYGKNQVAHIITYGTMGAKSSIADVARVMDLPLNESRAISKLVPEKPGIKLRRLILAPITTKEAKEGEKSLQEKENLQADDLEAVKKLRALYHGEDLSAKVLKEAVVLEGSVRNTGIHAAGIIIAPQDLTELIPVATSKETELWLTQIVGNTIEEAGVIKMDFLGLRTLSILKTALGLIKKNHGVAINLDELPLDDAESYKLFQEGETYAIFQFESPGMQKSLRDLKPDKLEDLVAMNALYRPGPMKYIPSFVKRKHGQEPVTYDLPELQEFLEETHGITVYQEQVMLISQKIAGFSKGQADLLRKAMGKKDRMVMDKMQSAFIEGAVNNGMPIDALKKIWNDWVDFAEYAFNKSHSTCYSVISYQTAYLKTHYPSEFMAAVLNHAGSIEKITTAIEECKRMGINVLGPDINESEAGFAVNSKGDIRFGFKGMKGLGENAIENILEQRHKKGNYKDIFDVAARVNLRAVSKKSFETLIYSGAFDEFKAYHRAMYLHTAPGDVNALEKIVKFGNVVQAQASNTGNTLFGDLEMPAIQKPNLSPCESWNLIKQLEHEKEVTGMYLSGHPLDNYKFELKHYQITSFNDFKEIKTDIENSKYTGTIKLAGLVTDVQHRLTRTGKNFGVVNIEDYTGKEEFFMWSEDYLLYKQFLQNGCIVFIEGAFKNGYKGWEFKINKMKLLESVKRSQTRKICITIPAGEINEQVIDFIGLNLKENPGNTRLQVTVEDVVEDNAATFITTEKGILLNDELSEYLLKNNHLEVDVICD